MNMNMIGVRLALANLVKREASVILARTRRCDRGVLFPQFYGCEDVTGKLGRRNKALILKSEDLPVMVL